MKAIMLALIDLYPDSHALSPEPWDNVTIPEVYVVVCALNVTNTTLSVDAQSKTPLEEQAFDSTRASDIFASAPDTSMFRLDGLELDLLWVRVHAICARPLADSRNQVAD